eukprot:CAMPEP_0206182376 /NCGR_PEP_ID=MMETSP0166-20121206/29_1 /ASSEMBLY_ACC=CAM_ASM_000260 /TAXON_ID=95228 /ORGANISM="Vannella robusta, Strain DIVA3 518/3/11/1/6" /LENGTH=146 /DNA_ID=CAMNT_0053597075 /DNA_START=21 /DNA_END=461 /DNA_ORIENTATION=-
MSNVGSLSYPAQCSSIKKGGYVVIKEKPCKVVETSTSKTGKHGHAKVHMVGIDIFTGKKCEEICPSTHNMQVPNVTRTEFLLLDISDDDYLSLFMPDGSTKDDLKLPSGELGEQIRAAFDDGKELMVCVLNALGHEEAKSFKESNN